MPRNNGIKIEKSVGRENLRKYINDPKPREVVAEEKFVRYQSGTEALGKALRLLDFNLRWGAQVVRSKKE